MRPMIQYLVLAAAATASVGAAPQPAWRIPVEVKALPNGLTVVVSEDHSAPTFGISTWTASLLTTSVKGTELV